MQKQQGYWTNRIVKVLLTDGSVIRGKCTSETLSFLTLKTRNGVERISQKWIDSVIKM